MFSHTSVLLYETVDALSVKSGGIYVDGTAGGGGHSAEIARRMSGGRLIAIDRDPDAVKAAGERLKDYPFAEVVHSEYSKLDSVLDRLGVDKIDGMLLDLGVSSHQLDTESRGFSYHTDAPLDMRMGQNGQTAADLVAVLPQKELARIFYEYADEKFSRKIAAEIVAKREEEPIITTAQMAELISRCYPAAAKRTGHPARKVFQALRMAVNHELEEEETGIESAFERLKPGGILAVITFHSVEDRLVKRKFATFCKGCECPPDFPVCICGKTPRGELVFRKPVIAGEDELAGNSRSRSAKLRAIRKL